MIMQVPETLIPNRFNAQLNTAPADEHNHSETKQDVAIDDRLKVMCC